MDLFQSIDPLLKFNIIGGKLCLRGLISSALSGGRKETVHLLISLTQLFFDKLLCTSRKWRKGGTERNTMLVGFNNLGRPAIPHGAA
jgi:hypothetical protein